MRDMKTRKVNTQNMRGNIDIDGEILDVMLANYKYKDVILGDVDFSEAIYSDGFIAAIERGSVPVLNSQTQHVNSTDKEYHHLVIDGECFRMFFNDN